MLNRKTVLDIVRPSLVSRASAVMSTASLTLPWLVRRSYAFHNPHPDLVYPSYAVPPDYYILLEMAAKLFVKSGVYPVPFVLSLAAFIFVAGMVIAFWTPIGGIWQVVAVYAIAGALVRSDYMLYQGSVEAEYTLGIGFHIGLIFALVTVFSLCPSGRSALIKGFRIAFR